MIILVINCGSSSIKYQLLDMKSDDVYELLAKGIVEKIGLPEGRLTHKPTGKEPYRVEQPIADHKVGMKLLLEALVDPGHGVLGSFDDIEAVGHRIVQGADFFSGSTLVNDDVLKKIEICCDFAPLHNPAHLLGIHAISHVLPDVPQVVRAEPCHLVLDVPPGGETYTVSCLSAADEALRLKAVFGFFTTQKGVSHHGA